MKATRRSFLAALASIPFLGRFVPHAPVVKSIGEHIWCGCRWGGKCTRPTIDSVYHPQYIPYFGPEVFHKGLSLTERMKKAREYDQGDQWDAR